jgi:hypothetical protein
LGSGVAAAQEKKKKKGKSGHDGKKKRTLQGLKHLERPHV